MTNICCACHAMHMPGVAYLCFHQSCLGGQGRGRGRKEGSGAKQRRGGRRKGRGRVSPPFLTDTLFSGTTVRHGKHELLPTANTFTLLTTQAPFLLTRHPSYYPDTLLITQAPFLLTRHPSYQLLPRHPSYYPGTLLATQVPFLLPTLQPMHPSCYPPYFPGTRLVTHLKTQ